MKAAQRALDAYRFAPRAGKDGRLLSQVARTLGLSRQVVFSHYQVMAQSSKAFPNSQQSERWAVLREFVCFIAKSEMTWFQEAVSNEMNLGLPVSVHATLRQIQSLTRSWERRGYKTSVKPDPEKARCYLVQVCD